MAPLPREVGRWAGGGGLAFAAHVLLALAVLFHAPVEMPSEPPAAMLIELEPMSAAPAVPSEQPPAPEEIAPPPEPLPEVAPKPEPEPVSEPEPLPIEAPEVETDAPIVVARVPRARPDVVPEIVEPPPDPPKVREPKPKKRQATPRNAAPAAAPRVARADAAPNPGASTAQPRPSPDRWRNAVFRHLERHKHYPRGAQASGIGGTVRVRFSIDANGNVLGHRITGSSGHADLDRAVSAMITRASPLPAPPPTVFRPGMSLEVPIRFSPR